MDEYERLIALGIVQEGERVELLRGEIYCMAAMGARHMACVTWLDRFFTLNVGAGALVRTQGPIRLTEDGEPEPDILVVRFRADFYRNRHPGPAEALLVIE
ncbi:MAG TPA: Uma2 family endonuclease, partial [Dehalococcoidia bacterium]|nr:Uma2 family endonuclease [Dehalococcoidia bacterium]